MFTAIICITFFVTLAMMVREGFWSNAIALVQIMFSGLVAFGCYQPLVVLADEKTEGSYTYALDIVVIWGLFTITMIVLKVLCEMLSKTRMRFIHPIDNIGGPALAAIAGYMMAGIVGASLHTAPLSKDALGGNMDYPLGDLSSAGIMALDISWLKLTESALDATTLGTGEKFSAVDFVDAYGDRREQFEETDSLLVKRS